MKSRVRPLDVYKHGSMTAHEIIVHNHNLRSIAFVTTGSNPFGQYVLDDDLMDIVLSENNVEIERQSLRNIDWEVA
ncbi:hypothetical protein PT274_01575 [Leuconostocaceae bacterium ESL0958]|nr:hypothetical protein [Leuconostocaceae bacterium ESL0958]